MAKESFEDLSVISSRAQSLEERKSKTEKKNVLKYSEEYHLEGRLEWICNLYLELDKYIMSLRTGIRKEFLQTYIKYSFSGILFAYVLIRKGGSLRVWVKTDYSSLEGGVPLFVRDYKRSETQPGVMILFDDQKEFIQAKSAMLNIAFGILKKALQKIMKKKPVKSSIKPVVELGVPSIHLSIGVDGYVTFRIHKDRKKLLERILQDLIFK